MMSYWQAVNPEISGLLGCEAMAMSEWFPTFRVIVLPSCSRWSSRRILLTLLCPDDEDTTILRNTRNCSPTDFQIDLNPLQHADRTSNFTLLNQLYVSLYKNFKNLVTHYFRGDINIGEIFIFKTFHLTVSSPFSEKTVFYSLKMYSREWQKNHNKYCSGLK